MKVTPRQGELYFTPFLIRKSPMSFFWICGMSRVQEVESPLEDAMTYNRQMVVTGMICVPGIP